MQIEPSLLSGVEPVEPPEGQTPPTTEVNGELPPKGQPAPEGEPVKTEADIRASILTELREGVPEKPEDYVIPDIEGLDKEALEGSTVYQTMREAAHELGMKPDKWNEFLGKWSSAEKQEMDSYRDEQISLLGRDESQVKQRLGTLSGALTRMLPEDEAKALMSAAVSAGTIKALERLISSNATQRTVSAVEAPDSAEIIRKLMNSKEYMGYEHERDPVIVARVEKYFAAGGTLKDE
jgi:hypothetical protein